jgi:two-component system chemotaxis sensor kinase CheA
MQERHGSLAIEERAALRQNWSGAIDHLRPFLDLGPADMINVPRADLEAVLEALADGASLRDVQRRLRRWRFEPTRPRLQRIADQARRLARNLGKGAIEVSIEDHDVRLPRSAWMPFWSSLVHVIRNAVDHGIETESERLAAGKAGAGRITLETRIAKGELVISIRDDGRGVDWKKIAKAARERGLPCSTPAELVDAMFSEGLSTADAVSATSGRGMGAAAAREATIALGGRIVVQSEEGQGTRFEFRFAARMLDGDAPPAARAA